jgi:hypothetical protein
MLQREVCARPWRQRQGSRPRWQGGTDGGCCTRWILTTLLLTLPTRRHVGNTSTCCATRRAWCRSEDRVGVFRTPCRAGTLGAAPLLSPLSSCFLLQSLIISNLLSKPVSCDCIALCNRLAFATLFKPTSPLVWLAVASGCAVWSDRSCCHYQVWPSYLSMDILGGALFVCIYR